MICGKSVEAYLPTPLSSVYCGLIACSNFCQSFGELDLARTFSEAAEKTKEAILKNLYDPALGRFLRGCNLDKGKVVNHDSTVDSSLAGVFFFGLLPADDPRVASTMKQIEEKLTVQTSIGGIARYEQDRYQAVSTDDATIPGNPWFVCTIWVAEWYIEAAKSRAELQRAREIIEWAASHTLESGIMAEQLDPITGAPVSVSPLTWSHGIYVDCVNRYLKKYKSLGVS
ncbi:MAG: glycoside hydrolase family 15 protein [Nitrososphaerales archaeon]